MNIKLCRLYKKLLFKYGALDRTFRHYMESVYLVYPDFHEDYRRTLKEYNAYRSRVKRRNEYISSMIDTFCTSSYNSLYLASFTFTDDVLSNTSGSTRKKYISDFLKDNTLDYFACIDFGKKTQREHYHALLVTDEPMVVSHTSKSGKQFLQFCNVSYPYGFYSLREVESGDSVKTARYAFKAGGYAFKSSESGYKAFHARKVQHMEPIPENDCLFA